MHKVDSRVPLTDYGMDSLLVLQLTNVFREDLGDGVSSTLLFDVESLEELAAHFLATYGEAVAALTARRRPEPESTTERWSLSRSQLKLWQVHKRWPDTTTYNVPILFEVHGELDEHALEEACSAQTGLHPILGAVFREEGGVPFMEIGRSRGLSFEKVDLAATSRAEQLAGLRDMANIPFDLATGPLARVHLVSLTAHKDAEEPNRLLLITVHHLVVDGTSAAILVRSLKDSYHAAVRPAEHRGDTPHRASYAEFVAWESALLDSPESEEHRAYWVRELSAPRSELALPRDRPYDPQLVPRSAIAIAKLTTELSQAFTARARTLRASVAALFLASYVTFLQRITGQSDLIVGCPTVARYEERFKDVVGQFVNCLPIRCTVAPGDDFTTLVKDVQKSVLKGIEHGAYPFLEIKRALGEEDGAPDPSIVVTNLLFQNFEGASQFTSETAQTPGELNLRPFDDLPDSGEMLVTAEIYQDPDSFKIFLKYDANAFDASTAQAMLDQWCAIIEYVAHQPEFSIGEDYGRRVDTTSR
jgi:polyketide synthase PksL